MAAIEPKTTVNIHAAKTHLSRLIERAEQGEETVIARSGRPVAQLVACREQRKRREPDDHLGPRAESEGPKDSGANEHCTPR